MNGYSFNIFSDVMELEKNSIRILIIDKWPFQLFGTLTTLSDAGYFNTYPVSSCVEALAELRNTSKPYDVLLCNTTLDFEELGALLKIASNDRLIKCYSMIGETYLPNKYISLFQDIGTTNLKFLGLFEKPLSSMIYGRALARVYARKNNSLLLR